MGCARLGNFCQLRHMFVRLPGNFLEAFRTCPCCASHGHRAQGPAPGWPYPAPALCPHFLPSSWLASQLLPTAEHIDRGCAVKLKN